MRHHFIGFRHRKTFPLRVSLPCGFHQGDWSSAAMHTERHAGRGCRTCILCRIYRMSVDFICTCFVLVDFIHLRLPHRFQFIHTFEYMSM